MKTIDISSQNRTAEKKQSRAYLCLSMAPMNVLATVIRYIHGIDSVFVAVHQHFIVQPFWVIVGLI